VPFERRAPPAGQEAKALVEALRDFGYGKRGDPRGSQFDRQRYTVELATDICDDRRVDLSQDELRADGLRAVGKQPQRRRGPELR
jgi:hypothetical protein